MPATLKNDRLIRALLRQAVDKTPVWIMRQAGRYLPEYRQMRKKTGDFLTLCKTPELACEVTLQPLARFPLDAAILFSDILTIPDAMGLGLSLVEKQGPQFAHPVRDKAAIGRLGVPDPETDLSYVMEALRLIREELHDKVPLIGFSGSPWTLATYMVEGTSGREFRLVKGMLYDEPALLHRLLAVLADAVSVYLNAQIAAGAQVLMLFDTWGGILTTPAYREFSLSYMQRIIEQLVRTVNGEPVPLIVFTKGAGLWLEEIAECGCDAVGLDWTINIADARARIGTKVALQGNLDPTVLYASANVVRAEVGKIISGFGKGTGHVFNLGHGIHPTIAPDNVAALVEAVHELSAPWH